MDTKEHEAAVRRHLWFISLQFGFLIGLVWSISGKL